MRYYCCSVATRNSQLCTRKNHSCSRSVWQQHHPDLERPHTAVFTFSLGIEQNPTGMCSAACYCNRKKNRTDYSYRLPGTHVPTKKMKYALEWKINSNNPHVHMISYEYEYLGSARTPVTKSSMYERPHRILFWFIQRTTSMYQVRIIRVSMYA